MNALARWASSEPVRLWLYSVLTVFVLPGLALAGWLTGEAVAFLCVGVGVVLVVGPAAEMARLRVYAPDTLRAAGVPVDEPGQHSPDRLRSCCPTRIEHPHVHGCVELIRSGDPRATQ